MEKKWIAGSTLILGIIAMPFAITSHSYAQDNGGLEDFSFDFDGMPLPAGAETDAETEATPTTTASEPQKDAVISEPATDITPPSQVGLDLMNADSTIITSYDAGPATVQHSGTYYDSNSIVPRQELEQKNTPREVDPKYEPGSKFVVVRKGMSAGSDGAKLVAAQRALKLGRYTSALELYEDLYTKMSKNEQVLMGLAVSQQYSGFTQSAIATYEELLKINPNNTDATVNMFGLLKAEYPSVAYRKMRDLWDSNSKSPAIAAQLGLMSASIGNAQDALKYLGVAASMEPHNAAHYYNMAVVTDQAGAYKDALSLYEKALEIDVAYSSNGEAIPRKQIYDRLAKLRRL